MVDSPGHKPLAAFIDQARTIRIPVHMVETINRQVRTQRQFAAGTGP
ncbi:MAG: hypothetical protein R2911_44580 [Caldilineaceae bacterium]